MNDFITNVKENNSIVIIETNGYLNNVGGEAVSTLVYEKMAQGKTKFLINMASTKIVNSIGVSILIEIIEKLQEDFIVKEIEDADTLNEIIFGKKWAFGILLKNTTN